MISKSLIDSFFNHDKFLSVNNVLTECNEMKNELYIQWKPIVLDVRKIL